MIKPDSIARRFARAIAKCACREGGAHNVKCERFTDDIMDIARDAMRSGKVERK
jgi:hypothetical protein